MSRVELLRWGNFAPREFRRELGKGFFVLARSEEQEPRSFGRAVPARSLNSLDFNENRAVFVPLAGGCFIHSEPLKTAPIGLLPGCVNPAANQVPDSILAHAGLPGHFGNGQNFSHREQKGFHEKGESGIGFGPRHLDGDHRARRCLDTRHAGPDRGSLLDESQMLPGALDGVVDRTQVSCFGIGKTRTALKINAKFQGLRARIEVGGNDLPR